MSGVAIAVPFEPLPVEKLATIVTACQQHKMWFDDFDWTEGESHRRAMVLARLADARSRTWEVYRDGNIVGILHADQIVPKVSCQAHFLFFDHELRSKRLLCLNTLDWLFTTFDLHTIRVEIPTYAAKLAGFVRKALYFRWEAEGRPFSWPSSAAPLTADEAKLGSRRHQAVFHNGVWHDLLLLSLRRDEFDALKKVSSRDGPHHASAASL